MGSSHIFAFSGVVYRVLKQHPPPQSAASHPRCVVFVFSAIFLNSVVNPHCSLFSHHLPTFLSEIRIQLLPPPLTSVLSCRGVIRLSQLVWQWASNTLRLPAQALLPGTSSSPVPSGRSALCNVCLSPSQCGALSFWWGASSNNFLRKHINSETVRVWKPHSWTLTPDT